MTLTSVNNQLKSSSGTVANVTMDDVRAMKEKIERTRELLLDQEEQYEQMQKDAVRSLNDPVPTNKMAWKGVVFIAEALLTLVELGIMVKGFIMMVTLFPSAGPEALLAFFTLAGIALLFRLVNIQLELRVFSPFRIRRGIGTLEDFERANNKS